MYNNDILKNIIIEFGNKEALIYCKIESAKNKYLLNECITNNGDVLCDGYDFEKDWWNNAYNKLKKNNKL